MPSLIDWAADPLNSTPPIALDSPTSPDGALLLGFLAPDVLAADIARDGFTATPGARTVYRRHGTRVRAYDVGDAIADALSTAADWLRAALTDDPKLSAHAAAVAAADAARPWGDWRSHTDAQLAEYRRHDAHADTLEASFPIDPASGAPVSSTRLRMLADALGHTAFAIRAYTRVRSAAVTRAASALPAPDSEDLAVAEWLDSLPAGRVRRSELHSQALDAGLDVSPRRLYALAAARPRIGSPRKQHGIYYFTVSA